LEVHLVLTPLQARAARKLLGWSQLDLAQRSGLTYDTIAHFETGIGKPRRTTAAAIRTALEEAGVEMGKGANPARLKPRDELAGQ